MFNVQNFSSSNKWIVGFVFTLAVGTSMQDLSAVHHNFSEEKPFTGMCDAKGCNFFVDTQATRENAYRLYKHMIKEHKEILRYKKCKGKGVQMLSRCNSCHKTVWDIYNHFWRSHVGFKRYKCLHCSMLFYSMSERLDHTKIHHKGLSSKRASLKKSKSSTKRIKTPKKKPLEKRTASSSSHSLNNHRINENLQSFNWCISDWMGNDDAKSIDKAVKNENDPQPEEFRKNIGNFLPYCVKNNRPQIATLLLSDKYYLNKISDDCLYESWLLASEKNQQKIQDKLLEVAMDRNAFREKLQKKYALKPRSAITEEIAKFVAIIEESKKPANQQDLNGLPDAFLFKTWENLSFEKAVAFQDAWFELRKKRPGLEKMFKQRLTELTEQYNN